MVVEQTGLGFDDGGPDQERLREFQADFTPGPIVRQGLERVLDYCDPMRFLDPCAGSGVFGQQLRQVYPPELSWAVEPRLEEKGNLKRHYHEVEAQTYQEAFAEDPVFDDEPFDLIATNSPFTEFVPLVEAALPLLAPKGVLMLLGLSDVMQRAKGKVEFIETCSPTYELRIAGPIGFRGPGTNPETGKRWGMDQRSYSWWVWKADAVRRRKSRGASWYCHQLPMLPSQDRQWKVRPGTEPGE